MGQCANHVGVSYIIYSSTLYTQFFLLAYKVLKCILCLSLPLYLSIPLSLSFTPTERAATHSDHGLSEPSREKEKLEQLQLVALKFKMIRELAKVKEQQAMKELQKIKPKSLGS